MFKEHCQHDLTNQLVLAREQEDTSEADAAVLSGVEKLKALRAELEDLEVQLENFTGIPRNKGVFREAVVRQPVQCGFLGEHAPLGLGTRYL